jgi:uncharacterized membrane protein YbhN (UPF0104 family)
MPAAVSDFLPQGVSGVGTSKECTAPETEELEAVGETHATSQDNSESRAALDPRPAIGDGAPMHARDQSGALSCAAAEAKTERRPVMSRLMLSAVLAVVICLAVILLGASHGLIAALRAFRLVYVAPVLVLSLVNYGVRYLRWKLYLRRSHIAVSSRTSRAVFASGLAMSITPGKSGELLKAAMLKDEAGVPLSLSAPVIVSERMTDLIAVVALAAVGGVRYPVARVAILIVAPLTVAMLTALAYSPALMVRAKRRFAHGWLQKLGGKGSDEAAAAFAGLLRGRSLIAGIGLGLLAWCAECLGLWLVLIGLGYGRLSLFAVVFVYALSTLAGAVSLLPGGLGVTEAGMAGLLALFVVPAGIAVAAIVLIRLTTLWFATLLGVGVYLLHRRSLAVHRASLAVKGVKRLGAN